MMEAVESILGDCEGELDGGGENTSSQDDDLDLREPSLQRISEYRDRILGLPSKRNRGTELDSR
jgi:hypothetical protein